MLVLGAAENRVNENVGKWERKKMVGRKKKKYRRRNIALAPIK